MNTFKYSEARQRLAAVLDQASREGQVQIRRQDGAVFVVQPVNCGSSPLADLPRLTSRFKPGELVRMIRDDQRIRADRILKAAASGLPKAKRKAKPQGAAVRPRRKSPKP